MSDLAAYVATLSRCATPGDARGPLAAPPPEVANATLDADAHVAVLTLTPGVLAGDLDELATTDPDELATTDPDSQDPSRQDTGRQDRGRAAEAPALPSARGPLAVLLYPATPSAGASVAVYGVPHVYAVAVRWPASGPGGDLGLDPATGRLTVRRRTVGPATSRYAADALDGRWRDMRNGHAWLYVEHEVPGEGRWLVSLSFGGDDLRLADLTYVGTDEPRDWDTWNREREEAARVRHDAWLDAHLGRGPLWGDTRRFPWGRVWSGYDERAAASSIRISYAAPA